MGRARKVTTTTIEDDLPVTSGQDIESEGKPEAQTEKDRETAKCITVDSPLDFQDYLEDFLRANNIDLKNSTVSLYRYVGLGYRRKLSGIVRYEGELPEYETIALEYGPGDYRIVMTIRKGINERLRQMIDLTIDYSWDKERKQKGYAPETPAIAPAPIQQAHNSSGDMLNMFQSFMALIQPLLTAKNQVAAPTDGTEIFKAMNNTFGDIMRDNMKNNMELLNDINRAKVMTALDVDPSAPGVSINEKGSEENEGGAIDIIKNILPLVKEWLPVLLGHTPASDATVNMLKNAPDF